ncbi:MAG TPA: response regulator transcription factor [Roseiflexaceae bacterium]|nr:response regulator transcription factor [Roseiflexaceae bacterium]
MADQIMIVDDDAAVLQGIALLLEQAGYAVRSVASGERAIELLSAPPPPALVILDVLMPGCDGFEVCRHIRALPAYIPVLMLSARDEVTDKVLGLESGADDYLTKPFEPRELVAQVRALLRFKQHAAGQLGDDPALVYGPLAMWPGAHHVEVRGRPVELAPKEWALLELFLRQPGKIFGRETLLRQVWGYDFAGDSRTVDVHIQRLRARLESHGAGALIQTVRGFGYRLVSEPPSTV